MKIMFHKMIIKKIIHNFIFKVAFLQALNSSVNKRAYRVVEMIYWSYHIIHSRVSSWLGFTTTDHASQFIRSQGNTML